MCVNILYMVWDEETDRGTNIHYKLLEKYRFKGFRSGSVEIFAPQT